MKSYSKPTIEKREELNHVTATFSLS